jgi:putative phosphoribosyl transferase
MVPQGRTDRGAEQPVTLANDGVTLDGLLGIPPGAVGVVLFAHGSGSGRFSPRNRYVAHHLQKGGIATLLIDLLTEDEAEDRRNVFDIDLLADRVLMAGAWLGKDERTRHLPLGYFGASTGAGAALQAAARRPSTVKAIVSRGGRPDLAERYLPDVTAPTLLLVGGYDEPVIEMNQAAFRLLRCSKELNIIPGATHLFEEPGTLEQVADHALDWFLQYFTPPTEHRSASRKKENQR